MPFWDRDIELVIMTHPDADHVAGFVGLLESYDVGAWAQNAQDPNTLLSQECRALIAQAGTSSRELHKGDLIPLGRGVHLEVLGPPAEHPGSPPSSNNDASVVVRLVWDRARFLLTGDLEANGELSLLDSQQSLSADVLKVAHHGSGGSSTNRFIEAVSPRYAVLSVGAKNRYGHPDPGTLERLARLDGISILRTDMLGTIEFITDGKRLWMRTEHSQARAQRP
jgi:competence protein ComEC